MIGRRKKIRSQYSIIQAPDQRRIIFSQRFKRKIEDIRERERERERKREREREGVIAFC